MSRSSPIKIAVDENIFKKEGFVEICKSGAAQILQPDIIRCGGITGFLEIVNAVQEYNVPICNHLLPELSVSLIASLKNRYLLEYDNFLPSNLFIHDFRVKNGHMSVPTTPGVGLELRNAVRYAKLNEIKFK